jgi:glycosyltransferase involved in cell wall biosynthesis
MTSVRRPRIAVLGIKALPAFAGADRVVERLLEQLDDQDATVYLVRSPGRQLSCTEGRHYVYVPALRGKHLRAFSYFLLSALHFLFKSDADVAHVHNSDFGVFCLLLRIKRRARLVGTFHGNPYERSKWGRFARTYLRLSEWLFVQCCHELTSVSASKRCDRRTVTFIPNGIETLMTDAAAPIDDLVPAISATRYAMFACGRLDETKGLHHLLQAYRSIDQAPALLVVGDFSHDPAYTSKVRDAARGDNRVVMCPRLFPREELYALVRGADTFVFPSDVEAMSMMLLEALACRTPVVCSDIQENVAVVGPDYPLLFKAGESASLAGVLRNVLADPAGAQSALAPFFDKIATEFRWPDIANQYRRVYERAVPALYNGNEEALGGCTANLRLGSQGRPDHVALIPRDH